MSSIISRKKIIQIVILQRIHRIKYDKFFVISKKGYNPHKIKKTLSNK